MLISDSFSIPDRGVYPASYPIFAPGILALPTYTAYQMERLKLIEPTIDANKQDILTMDLAAAYHIMGLVHHNINLMPYGHTYEGPLNAFYGLRINVMVHNALCNAAEAALQKVF